MPKAAIIGTTTWGMTLGVVLAPVLFCRLMLPFRHNYRLPVRWMKPWLR
jgi:hypothetical protein